MYTKTVIISSLLAVAEARFGQEQIPVAAVSALSNFGNPGEAATLAGGIPGVLLAAASPCDKLTLADKIVTSLGTDASVIKAAAGLVAAEQNFNPFVVSIPAICGDASLPATAELRGIVPLVDPAVTGSDTENANSATSLTTPFDATGLSVAQVMQAQGFSNFTIKGGDATSTGAGSNNNAAASSTTSAADAATTTASPSCAGSTVTVTASSPPAATTTAATDNTNTNTGSATEVAGTGAVTNDVTGNFDGFQASSLGLDFGTCTPTVKFEESLNGRKAGEFTFQAQDPVVNKGQQEALNPNIIFNRICDQLVNVCGAADDAHQACKDAQTKLGGGAKNSTTADAWNTELGFAGTNINPDNAPKTGLVGHT